MRPVIGQICALLLAGAAQAQPMSGIPGPPVLKPGTITQPPRTPQFKPDTFPTARQPHQFTLVMRTGDYDFDTPAAATDGSADFRITISAGSVTVQGINGATMGHTDPTNLSFSQCETIGYTDQRWIIANAPTPPVDRIAACVRDNGGALTLFTFNRLNATTFVSQGTTWK